MQGVIQSTEPRRCEDGAPLLMHPLDKLNASAAMETTSNEINESIGASPAKQAKLTSLIKQGKNGLLQQSRILVNDQRELSEEARAVNGRHVLNDASFVNNASSNENLLSPNMMSFNSLSPTHANLMHHPSQIDKSLETFSPAANKQQETNYSSLERSIQKVVEPINHNRRDPVDSASGMVCRKIRKTFIRRKFSGPATRMFPPGFFPDHSIDSRESKHFSPRQISVDDSTEQGKLNASRQRRLPVQQTFQSHPHLAQAPQLPQQPKIFSQRSVQVKQSQALAKVRQIFDQNTARQLLNATLSPTRCTLEINGSSE